MIDFLYWRLVVSGDKKYTINKTQELEFSTRKIDSIFYLLEYKEFSLLYFKVLTQFHINFCQVIPAETVRDMHLLHKVKIYESELLKKIDYNILKHRKRSLSKLPLETLEVIRKNEFLTLSSYDYRVRNTKLVLFLPN